MRLNVSLVLAVAFATATALPAIACGQAPPDSRIAADSVPPPVPREFRAAWVATVDNMDWPSRPGLSTAQQQAEMLAILDKLVELRMNAIVLQVRPSADAFYQSSIEPWSDYLTGEMGRAPEPFYDPLTFATDEAHKRGLEMHVWINPYRAKHPSSRSTSASHVIRARPELVRRYGSMVWMDPGDPVVRARTTRVVLDIVSRYDIDAMHMDDYFYPYKESRNGRELEFPDESTYRRYRQGGGILARDDWRRENVNLLVKELYDGIHAVKPWVRFGISPFGIWRPGYPASVRGLDQYTELYADARKWFHEGWVDYFTPQLYWAANRPQQRYDLLLEWWAQQNLKGRHLWPGNYTGKVGFTNSQAFTPEEIIQQIRLTRAQPGATGNVHFNMKVFLENPHRLNERLTSEVYTTPALVPASPWLGRGTPAAPRFGMRSDSVAGYWVLDLAPGSSAPPVEASAPWLWVVQLRTANGWTTRIVPAAQRLHVLAPRSEPAPIDVRVTAIDRVGNAGPTARLAPAPAPPR
jgi:uncharacterized lipoprotein YddW (UPF0748 family)